MEISLKGESRKLVNFCANNYLGLSANHQLIEVYFVVFIAM